MEDDLKKGHLDRDVAKDRDRWKSHIMGQTSNLCEHGKRDVESVVKVSRSSPELSSGVLNFDNVEIRVKYL